MSGFNYPEFFFGVQIYSRKNLYKKYYSRTFSFYSRFTLPNFLKKKNFFSSLMYEIEYYFNQNIYLYSSNIEVYLYMNQILQMYHNNYYSRFIMIVIFINKLSIFIIIFYLIYIVFLFKNTIFQKE